MNPAMFVMFLVFILLGCFFPQQVTNSLLFRTEGRESRLLSFFVSLVTWLFLLLPFAWLATQ
jgi:dolichyl-phosphate-mannose--protein O-mannosyl transferase